MKRQTAYRVAAVTFLLAFTAITAAAQDINGLQYPKLGKIEIPEIDRVTLDNGLRLYLVEDKELPVFNISVRINCGSHLEPPDKIGLADICGTCLRTGGTQKWTGDEIDDLLEGVGATVETSIGLTHGTAVVNVLSEYTDLGLEVLAEILRRPVFDEDKIELARVQMRSQIARRNDDPQQILNREFNKIIYSSESPYARHSEYKTINAVSQDDLVSFHSLCFNPENIQMAIWGDFDKEEIIEKIKTHFGDWERGSAAMAAQPKVTYDYRSRVFFVNKTDINQSNVYVGHLGGLVTDEDYADRIVMNNVLGAGVGGRMFNRVRTKEGLAYSTYGEYSSHISYPGVFYSYAGTRSETTGKAIREIIKVIRSMHDEPPTADEMRKAKESYLNSFVFNYDTKAEVVNRIMNFEFFGLPENFLEQLKERIENVTADDVVAAARKNLRPDALQILVVGKVEDFETPLEELDLGPVEEIDVTIPTAEDERELTVTPENLEKGMEILRLTVNAHGGVAKFKTIKSTSTKGTMTFVTPQGELPVSIERSLILPDKESSVASVFGQTIYDVRNGEIGWKTDQRTMSLVDKTPEDISKNREELARSIIVIFREADNPSYRAVFDGSGEVNDIAVDFVSLIDAADEVICRFGINRVNHDMVCRYATQATPMGEGMVEQIFTEYRDINGMRIPTASIRNLNNQKIGEVKYTEFLINSEIPESVFTKPE